MIYSIRTTSGREDIVLDMLAIKAKKDGLEIISLFHPAEIKGYVFVEGGIGTIKKVLHGMLHAKGLIETPVKLGELQQFLAQKKTAAIKLELGDIAEIIGGPFKGEKGKLKRIDKVKDEVTVELLEASIPIPVTITTEFVKLVQRAKKPAGAPVKEPVHEEPVVEEEKEGQSVFEKVSEDIQKHKPEEALRQAPPAQVEPAPAAAPEKEDLRKKKEKGEKEAEE